MLGKGSSLSGQPYNDSASDQVLRTSFALIKQTLGYGTSKFLHVIGQFFHMI